MSGACWRQQEEQEQQQQEEFALALRSAAESRAANQPKLTLINDIRNRKTTMAFIAQKPTSGFTPPPPGLHIARCYRLVDMGTQKRMYQGEDKGEQRKILAGFELLTRNDDGSPLLSDEGRPFTLSKSWGLTLHEKSSLRKDLESWRGKQFSPEEEAGFDVSKLLGAYCMINVVEETGQEGKSRTVIKAFTPVMRGMEKPSPVNENEVFDSDNPDMQIFNSFSEKMKEIIMQSREWRARAAGAKPGMQASKPTASAADLDDDIPF